MFEVIEKTLLTALGAASLTQKKAEELTAELKERFNLSEEEGQCLIEKLKKVYPSDKLSLRNRRRMKSLKPVIE